MSVMTSASVSSCRTSRSRLEPRATRIASSRLRSAARAAKALARFTQTAASSKSASTFTLERNTANALAGVSHQARADQSHPYALVCLRILLRQLRRDRVQIRRRLLRRHARLEPADRIRTARPSRFFRYSDPRGC